MVTGCATILRHGLFALTPRLLILKCKGFFCDVPATMDKGKLSASALFLDFSFLCTK